MAPRNELLQRAYLVMGLVFVIALAIIAKVARIQWWEGEHWREAGKTRYLAYKEVEAQAGNILTEDQSILATSVANFVCRVDLASTAMQKEDFNAAVDSLGWYLSRYIDRRRTPEDWAKLLRQRRAAGDRSFLIKKDATYTELERLKTFPLFRLGRYRGGFYFRPVMKRKKPFGGLAHRTIGYVREGAQPVGVEGAFLDVLSGEKGKRLFQKLPNQVWVPVNDLSEIAPKPGLDVVTTLDMGLQDRAHSALLSTLERYRANSGVAAVMEVNTGKIRAMVNLQQTERGYAELYNDVIGSAVEPGSIFKTASVMAMLEDGHVDLEDMVDVEKGEKQFYDQVMHDSSPHGYDTITVRKAFEISSNVGIAKLVDSFYRRQPHHFIRNLENFHLDQPTGVDLKGEGVPMIKHPKRDRDTWSGITLPWMSMGYEVEVTPLQMLTFYAAIANGGTMMRPMIVSGIQREGELLRQIHPEMLDRRIASRKTIRHIRELLEGVVLNGTAKRGQTRHYNFAGKTGTARIGTSKGRMLYRSSFVGYFPAESPRYAVIVMVNGAYDKYYGSDVALPVFRDIADYCFAARKEMFPVYAETRDAEKQLAELPQWEAGMRRDFTFLCADIGVPRHNAGATEWTITKTDQESGRLQLLNRRCPPDEVPNVIGMGLRDAIYLLENAGLKVGVSGVGKVRSQSVRAGTKANGQYIVIRMQ